VFPYVSRVCVYACFRYLRSWSAITEHIDILRRGPRAWNAWRASNPDLVPDLTGIVLRLSERQMGPINGGPINLAGAVMSQASLRFATLTAAILEAADLSDADLSDARLDRANLAGANLHDAVLERADFAGANLANANLSGACLKEARNLTQDQIDEAKGDSHTLLPQGLTRPRLWSERISQVALGRRAPLQPRSDPAAASDTISWLVGGPPEPMRAANVNTPRSDPQEA
jgi:hypothetical protein